MIRIFKGEAPAVLLEDGATCSEQHCCTFNEDPNFFLAGKPVPVRSAVYGHDDVRQALVEAQHGKCCYCEVRICPPYMDGHVEHWRPKGRVRQLRGHEGLYPGYYWLAYSWDNLLLACQACNRNFKSDQFPLVDPNRRARSHSDDLDAEEPLLIKPDRDDPAEHIRWKEDQPIPLSPKGENTIRVVGLIRELDPSRGEVLTRVRKAIGLIRRFGDVDSPAIQSWVDEERASLRAAVLPTAPHSAMIHAYLVAQGVDLEPQADVGNPA